MSEAIPIKISTFEVICDFMTRNIVSQFGILNDTIIDNETTFSSKKVTQHSFLPTKPL